MAYGDMVVRTANKTCERRVWFYFFTAPLYRAFQTVFKNDPEWGLIRVCSVCLAFSLSPYQAAV